MRYRVCIDQERIPQMLKAGYGQGTGADYRPWLEVTHVPSRGLVCRVQGHITGRIHHLLSRMETTYWYPLDWTDGVRDIREQFPLLPIEDTLRIAKTLGYRHPQHPKTRRPIVMTTDFLITMAHGDQEYEVARSIKPGSELEHVRVCEKLAIERHYWAERGVDWGIVTERELNLVLARNVRLVAPYWDIGERISLTPACLEDMARFLTEAITAHNVTLTSCGAAADGAFACTSGTGLTVAYHLLARRRWPIDWQQPLHPQRPLALLLAFEGEKGAV